MALSRTELSETQPPTSGRSECVPPAIVICRCKFAEHKFRSLTIAERPSASPSSSEISSWIALLRYTCLSLIPQGNLIVETWVACPQIKT